MKSVFESPFLLNGEVIRLIKEYRRSGSRMPILLFLGGGWNTGKSTNAIILATQMGVVNVIHTDVVRSALRVTLKKNERDCLMKATYEAWRCESRSFSNKAVGAGFLKQSNLIAPAIRQCIKEASDYGKDTIIEGMHLHPAIYYTIAQRLRCLFIWLKAKEEEVEKRIVKRCETSYRGRTPDRYLKNIRFNKIMAINNYLLNEARKNRLPILDLDSNEDKETLSKMLFEYIISLRT